MVIYGKLVPKNDRFLIKKHRMNDKWCLKTKTISRLFHQRWRFLFSQTGNIPHYCLVLTLKHDIRHWVCQWTDYRHWVCQWTDYRLIKKSRFFDQTFFWYQSKPFKKTRTLNRVNLIIFDHVGVCSLQMFFEQMFFDFLHIKHIWTVGTIV